MYLLIYWNDIFRNNLSSHKFVNVIKYCKFYLVQKSKQMSLLKYLFRNWVQGDITSPLEHQMPVLHFYSHSYFISENIEAVITGNLDSSPFIDLTGNGWRCVCVWGGHLNLNDELSPSSFVTWLELHSNVGFSMNRLSQFITLLRIRIWKIQTAILFPYTMLFISPNPSTYLEAKTSFWLLDYFDKEIWEWKNQNKNNRIFHQDI